MPNNPHRPDSADKPDAGTAAYSKQADEAQGANAPRSEVASEGPGSRIGPYKLLQEIGEGGMGTVFMAEQQEPVRRKVALKVIKPGMDSKEVLARFEAERQALALMDHPNIAKVLDSGTTDAGRPYFGMELVKGVRITKYCDELQLSVRERLQLFVPVCQAIQHAHQKGVIHRDIKPSNVLVASYDGKPVPKVIDFGVAKALGHQLTERTMFTAFGHMVGTLEYMSPEQAELNAVDIDTRSDIYSLGVLLYQLLTGTTPQSRKRLKEAALTEALRLIREEEPPKPSTRLSSSESLPSISAQRKMEPAKLTKMMRGELDWIVMKALEKDRSRRYETANGFARDIERFLHDEPVEACPPSATYRLRKLARKYRTPLGVASAILLVLVAGVIASAWQAVRATNAEEAATAERDRAVRAEVQANTERDNAQKERDNAKEARDAEKERAGELAVALKEAEAARLLEQQTRHKAEGDLATSTMMLARSRFEDSSADLANNFLEQVPVKYRGSGWGILKNQFAGSMFTLYGHSQIVTSVSFSPDGQVLASASWDQTVRLWDAKTGQALRVLKGHTKLVLHATFSPDGLVLASASSDGTVRLWDTKTGQELRVLKGHTELVKNVRFSPDGQVLASSSGDQTIRLWHSKTGQELRVLKGHASEVTSLSFSPDGQVLASASWDQTVRLWDAKSGQELRVLKGHTDMVWSVSFSPDGQALASASTDKTVRLWAAKTGQEQGLLRGHPTGVLSVSFSPDGQVLASAGVDWTVRLWDAKSRQALRVLKGHTSAVTSECFSPDGQWLASASQDKTVRLWDAKTGQELRVLKGHTSKVTCVNFSPDGQVLASASNDKTVRLWDSKTVKQLHVLKGHTDFVRSVSFSPDGQTLASASGDMTVRLWNAKTGQELRVLKGHTGSVNSVSFSPHGQVLASASQDQTVRLWDAKSGKQLRVLTGHTNSVYSVSFSPDGQVLASASADKMIRLWDASSGQELHVLKRPISSVATVSFSPSSQVLASVGAATVLLWDAKSGQELGVLKGHTVLASAVSFSPDGQVLASASWDQTLRLWDAKNNQELRVLKGHSDRVTSVSFSPDGQVLASASDDQTVRLWDVRSAWVPPGQPIPAAELSFRRWVAGLDLQWHIDKRMEFEKDGSVYAAAFHRSWEHHARGVLAFEAGDFKMAYAHFIAAAALKPKPPTAEK